MKNNKKIFALGMTALMVFGIVGSASAESMGQHINQRQQYESRRINQGVRSGELTKLEAARLRQNQQRIKWTEAKARRDGHLSVAEAKRINQMQTRQSQAIRHQSNDRQDRDRNWNNGWKNHRRDWKH